MPRLMRDRSVAVRTPRMVWAAVGLVFLPAAALGLHVDPLKAASGVYRNGRVTLAGAAEVLYAEDGKAATVHVVSHPGDQV